jgi:hypothetical protein
MLFGDAARDTKVSVSNKNPDIGANVTASRTETHLGPGAYFTSHNENIRGGWVKRSFSVKQPMSPTHVGERKERYRNYTDSVMSRKGEGLVAQGGFDSNSTPGPGHYNAYDQEMSMKQSPRSPFNAAQSRVMSPHGGISSGSPRMLGPSASVKGEVVFQGKMEEHNTIGPGYYYNAHSYDKQIIKKSFNVRASEGNSRPRSGRKSNSPSQMQQHQQYSYEVSPGGSEMYYNEPVDAEGNYMQAGVDHNTPYHR